MSALPISVWEEAPQLDLPAPLDSLGQPEQQVIRTLRTMLSPDGQQVFINELRTAGASTAKRLDVAAAKKVLRAWVRTAFVRLDRDYHENMERALTEKPGAHRITLAEARTRLRL